MKIFSTDNRALAGISSGHFSIELYTTLLVPLYPIITLNLGINLAKISFIIAIGHFVASMLQPYFGFISDKLTHRIFIVWGLIIAALFIPFSIKYNNALYFSLCLLIGMTGNAFFHPQASSLMRDFNKNNPNITRNMGIFLGLGTLGYALGPYVSTLSVEIWGYDNLIYLSLIGLIASVLMFFCVPKIPEREKTNKGSFLKTVLEIFKNKTCMELVYISVIKSVISICFVTHIPFLLQNYGYSLKETGIIVTLFSVFGGIASMTSSKFEKLLTQRGIIAVSLLGILPFCILFLIFLGQSKFLAAASFCAIGYCILMSVGVVLVQAQKALPQYTGVVSGAIQGVGWGLGALFLSPMGVIGQYFGIDKALIIISVISFIAGLLCLRARSLKF